MCQMQHYIQNCKCCNPAKQGIISSCPALFPVVHGDLESCEHYIEKPAH